MRRVMAKSAMFIANAGLVKYDENKRKLSSPHDKYYTIYRFKSMFGFIFQRIYKCFI